MPGALAGVHFVSWWLRRLDRFPSPSLGIQPAVVDAEVAGDELGVAVEGHAGTARKVESKVALRVSGADT